jgi:hypothetical protein
MGTNNLEDLGVVEWKILGKESMNGRTGFEWFRIKLDRRFYEHGNKISFFLKAEQLFIFYIIPYTVSSFRCFVRV